MDEGGNPRPCEILVFEIGGRRFGLPAAEVRELLRAVTIEPLPRARPSIEGVINLRGTIVPVLDLRARLRLPAKAAEPADYLLVVGTGARPVALRIDRALELKTLDAADVEHVGDLRGDEGDVAVVARLPDRLMLLLDPRGFLSSAEAETVAAEGGGPS